jgi:hypothetical protein
VLRRFYNVKGKYVALIIMKRWEIIDILREILRVCGPHINVEMVWLKGIPENAGINNGKYQILMRATFDDEALACVEPIKEKYGLKMTRDDGLWIFTKKENGSERVAPSASAA